MCRQNGKRAGGRKTEMDSFSVLDGGGEERRREGDVRASFKCLCPVQSARSPGLGNPRGLWRGAANQSLPPPPCSGTDM